MTRERRVGFRERRRWQQELWEDSLRLGVMMFVLALNGNKNCGKIPAHLVVFGGWKRWDGKG